MAYVKKVRVGKNQYYYLYHTIRQGGRIIKKTKYIGGVLPDKDTLEKMKNDFVGAIKEKSKKWFLAEDAPNSHPLMLAIPMIGFTDLTEYGVDVKIRFGVIDSKNGTESLIFRRDLFTRTGKHIFRRVLSEPEWALRINEETIRRGVAYFDYSEKVLAIDLKGLSTGGLAKLYEGLWKMQESSHIIGLLWYVMETEEQYLTKYLLSYLGKRAKIVKSDAGVGGIFSLLTTPTVESYAQREEESLLRIAARIQSDENIWTFFNQSTPVEIEAKLEKSDKDIYDMLREHYGRFCWLPYMYEGPAWKLGYFIEVLAGIVKNNADISSMLDKVIAERRGVKEKQDELLQQLGVDERHEKLFEIGRGIVYTKGYRKDCLYHGVYCMEPLLREVGRRLNLTLKQVRRFMPWEIRGALTKGEYSEDVLNRRFRHYVFYAHDGKWDIYTGEEADGFMGKLDMEEVVVKGVHQLNGECACPGLARGVVKIIQSTDEMRKMQEGDILVAHCTNPDVVPAMKKAGAIVTDMGGITCHAAIVSRELKIPCVIGTKVATKALKDGDLIEVDATHGIVRKLES